MIRDRVPRGSLVRQFAAEEAVKAGVPVEILLRGDRRAAVVWARARLCRRLRALGYSLPSIGAALHLNHATVFYHLRRLLPDEPPALTPRVQPAKGKKQQPRPVSFAAPPSAPRQPNCVTAITRPPLARLMGGR